MRVPQEMIDPSKFKAIIREYYKQFYTNKFDNLNNGQISLTTKLPNRSQEKNR